MMRPTSVNTDDTARLIQFYKDAYQSVLNEFQSATDFGQKYRKSILANIRGILDDLGANTQAWLDENIPLQYQFGMDQAVVQLEQLGADVAVDQSFTSIDRKAVAALISDSQAAFGDAITGVGRNARNLLSQATKDEIKFTIAQGTATLNDRKMIVNNVKQTIQNDGITALVDRSGRSWTIDRYADMLARTKSVEARNTGLQNQMLENGYDLVQVSSHGATDVCGDWEGAILSLTGDTPGYDTVDDAEADGLFHPNCAHAINAIEPDLAAQTDAYNTDTGDYGDNQS